jgi:5-methyltetrahydrofolate--homocysteine methyltransferase
MNKKTETHYSGVVQLQRVNDGKIAFARSLRKNMTLAERILWSRIKEKRCGGYRFRRQQIIEGFVVDFFCAERNLSIEVDGAIHDTEEQKKRDERRRKAFKARHIQEIRFRNEEVIEGIDLVFEKILEACKTE